MLLSIALILVSGMTLGWICKKIKLPSLLGMLITGIVFGPYVLNAIDPAILNISSEIRKIALIIILTRAGLSLDISGLKKIGRPAVMMCFVPATFELAGMLLLGPSLLGLSTLEAAIMGAVLAAVSPAVVVPRMVRLMEEEYGTAQGIPQLILAGASVDDVYVIVLFTTFISMIQGDGISVMKFVNIPVSITAGIIIGLLSGWCLAEYFKRVHIRDTVKILVVLSWSFVLVAIEDALKTNLTFSALIAIMFIGVALQKYRPEVTSRLSAKYNKLWVGAEVFLFVLVGASVNINYLGNVGIKALVVIAGALVLRMLGVFVCLLGTKLNTKEKLFAMMAYTPKATVQAAIGGIPLSLGLACGDTVLTVAVLAIVITAPLGAFAIDLSYKKLLKNDMHNMKLHFLKTKWSDIIILEYKGEIALVDTGFEEQYEQLDAYLKKMGVKDISFILLTHFHRDHYGSILKLIDNYKVHKVYFKEYSGYERFTAWGTMADDVYREDELKKNNLMREKIAKKSELIMCEGLKEISFSDIVIKLFRTENTIKQIYEDESCQDTYHEIIFSENQNSMAAFFEVNGKTVFLGGDVMDLPSSHPLANYVNADIAREIGRTIDIYKAPHHGTIDTASDAAMEIYKPKKVIITNEEKYISESSDICDRLRKANPEVDIIFTENQDVVVDI